MPYKISKTARPVLGSSFLALLLASPSLMALDEGVCYSVQLASTVISSTSDLDIGSAPSNCELISFTNTKSIRCGCYDTLEEANTHLQNILPMRKNAMLAETRKSRFKNTSILPTTTPVLAQAEDTNETEAITQEVAVVVPITKTLELKKETLAVVKEKHETEPVAKEVIIATPMLNENADVEEVSEFSGDLEGFSDEENDLDGFAEESEGFGEDSDLSGFDEEEESLDGFSDDDLDGFGDENAQETQTNEYEEPPKISAMQNLIGESSLSGSLSFKTTVGLEKHEVEEIEYSGVNQAQTALALQFDKKLSSDWRLRISGDAYYDAIYDINDHNDYNDEILEQYRTQLRFDDTYIHGRLTNEIDLKAGRQIVIWGKSDNIRITDVINPTDNRLPGVTDIEYIRLPTTMAKFDWYVDDWGLSAMLITEARVSISPPVGSEFLPIDTGLLGTVTLPITPVTTPVNTPEVIEPSSSFDNLQYGLAANGVFSGWDLSFYAANVFDKDNHSEEVIAAGSTPSNFVYSKIYMLGTAFNMVKGSWLIKGEAAFLNGLNYSTTSDEKNRLDTLVGLEYMGFRDTSMSLELANRHIFGYEDVMENAPDGEEQNSIQTIIRVTRNFMHETLSVTALANILGPDFNQGGFARVWGEYELGDALSLDLGVVFYQGGTNAYFEAIKANDRVFADLTYSF